MVRVSLAIVLVLLASVHAQQPPPGTPAPKALVPVAASSVAETPDAYVGQYVSMFASVDRTLSALVFSVDQDRTQSTGKDVLVLTRLLNDPVEPNTTITVIGEIVRFDPAELLKRGNFPLDLAPELIEKWRGRPAILATTVINSAGVDLTRRLPPPMTPDEEVHSATMKQVNAANGALRKAMEASDSALARENAAALTKAFADTETFWKRRGKTDAITWAQDAHQASRAIDAAAAAGKWDEVKTSAGALAKACQACHGAYRERFDDGSYRIRK